MTASIDSAQWRKASYSSQTNSCVELAHLSTAVAVRDSKNPAAGALLFQPAAFAGLLDAVKSGGLDLS